MFIITWRAVCCFVDNAKVGMIFGFAIIMGGILRKNFLKWFFMVDGYDVDGRGRGGHSVGSVHSAV